MFRRSNVSLKPLAQSADNGHGAKECAGGILVATFVYEAVDPSGRIVKNKVEADNEQVVLAKLHEQQFHVVSLGEAKAGIKMQIGGARRQRSSCKRWLFFPGSLRP